MSPTPSLPALEVPARPIVALEHPMIIKNIDNGLKTFGKGAPIHQILELDDYDSCFPLYLRPEDPSCAPILSHNAATTNVLLKITVPKRTGLKRKRGSNDPFVLMAPQKATLQDDEIRKGQDPSLMSYGRLDKPETLRQILQDNEGKFEVEPIGTIDHTHRYRGLSDFHYSTTHSPFMAKVRETIMTVEKVRQFHLDPSRGVKPMEDLIPPPTFSDHTLPFNWAYRQNEHIRPSIDAATGQTVLVNYSAPKKMNAYYIPHTTPAVPTEPQEQLSPFEAPVLEELLAQMRIVFDERPIWTRRALGNRLGQRENSYNFRRAMSYIGYQFRGGPWRDGVIKYGVDPRTDPKYRVYQTLFFKIFDDIEKGRGVPWMDGRIEYSRKANEDINDHNSHTFDGTSVKLDGKVWQMCDITDPLLSRLLSTTTVRTECDADVDGWFCNGTMAKVKAIMRAKISAIRLGRSITEDDFKTSLEIPDHVEGKTSSKYISVPVPDWRVDRDQTGRLGSEACLGGIRRREAKTERGLVGRGRRKRGGGAERAARGGRNLSDGEEADPDGGEDMEEDVDSILDARGDQEPDSPAPRPAPKERKKWNSRKMQAGSRSWRQTLEESQNIIQSPATPGFYGTGKMGKGTKKKSTLGGDQQMDEDMRDERSISARGSGVAGPEIDPRVLEAMDALNAEGGFDALNEGRFGDALGNMFGGDGAGDSDDEEEEEEEENNDLLGGGHEDEDMDDEEDQEEEEEDDEEDDDDDEGEE